MSVLVVLGARNPGASRSAIGQTGFEFGIAPSRRFRRQLPAPLGFSIGNQSGGLCLWPASEEGVIAAQEPLWWIVFSSEIGGHHLGRSHQPLGWVNGLRFWRSGRSIQLFTLANPLR